MSQDISNIRERIYYAIRVIPTYQVDWPDTLYNTYKGIVEAAALIEESDVTNITSYNTLFKSTLSDEQFLNKLKNSVTINPEIRQEVIDKLSYLDLAIRTMMK